MLRQVGLAIGVALLIAVLGTPHGGHATVLAYRNASLVLAGVSLIAAAIGAVMLRRSQLVPGAVPTTTAPSQPVADPRETAVTGA